jgi:hypothetical protein
MSIAIGNGDIHSNQRKVMTTYIFKVQVKRGIIEVRIDASGYFAAESAVRSMYPDCRIITWHSD